MPTYRAAIHRIEANNLREKIRDALEWLNWKDKIHPDSHLWIKPNLTFPEFRPGVTTSPHFMAAVLDVLRERTPHLTLFEADGGNRSYPAEKAFHAHKLYEICESRDVRLVNITQEPWQMVPVPTRGARQRELPLAKEMLENCDMMISLPVPKMHFVTRFTGAIKNHWGCVPDSMRLRNHFYFQYAINEIMKQLQSQITIVDGEYFLDDNGPVTGEPVKMDLLIAADYPLTADTLLTDIMGVDPHKIGYFQTAWERSPGARSITEIDLNVPLDEFKTHSFSYHRDPVDYLALLGFHSQIITWIVYLSPLKKFIHWLVGVMRGGSRQVESYYNDVIEIDKVDKF